ncbi:MAG: DUF1499 domain-containing protein [Candidatus Hydrogenedens sp.]|nr:DUF1499 domain-containing protein [Candidatus Hydrogenedens sp.]
MLHKITLGLSVGSIVLLGGGLMLANKEIIPPMAGLVFFVLAGLCGVAALLCSIGVIATTQAFHIAMVGMLGFIPALVLVWGVSEGTRYPPINDITTDIENPPAFEAAAALEANAGRDMSFPGKFGGIIRDAYPDLAPHIMERSKEQAFSMALEAAKAQPRWEIIREDEDAGIIECVASTQVFKWHDDVIIRVQDAGGGKTRIDMRSKSREGKGDIGANAKRIRKFFTSLGS